MATFETWVVRTVTGAFVFAMLAQIFELLLLDGFVYVSPEWLRIPALLTLLSLSVLVALALVARRIRGKSSAEWFLILAFLPAALLLCLFIQQSTQATLGIWLRFSGLEKKETITIFSSKVGSGRGCKIRNEFMLDGLDLMGHWCTSGIVNTGKHEVVVLSGRAGRLIINAPGLPSEKP